MGAADLLFRVGKAFRNYANPIELGLQRLGSSRHVWVTDRRTGLRFKCLRGADAMLPETLHSRHYDVPMAPVGPRHLVLDVGANHGFVSCDLARRGATVLAFEPAPEVFELLEANVALNGLAGSVQASQIALASQAGSVQLHRTRAFGGGMSTTAESYARNAGVAYAAPILVQARSLRDVLRDVAPRRVRLLKLDCEGAEFEILASLGAIERAVIDSIALEYHVRAYPLASLVELLLSWEEFVLYKLPAAESTNEIVHVVHRDAVRAWAKASG